ncbi:hypothetical protein IMZ16_04100 [Cruoricaptor ignavus]|uniref:Uncharacterized protein n=1 Tax=Cruoricaptor ignavus TaxID=1118202 RepID=A0A7M1T6M4_9FLAO|nr:hypothetical protein [Cruoricaptor ignavus]QOR74623.1 hypothetical protein IMZ16_04100 [Cruoricaptor ignavus]
MITYDLFFKKEKPTLNQQGETVFSIAALAEKEQGEPVDVSFDDMANITTPGHMQKMKFDEKDLPDEYFQEVYEEESKINGFDFTDFEEEENEEVSKPKGEDILTEREDQKPKDTGMTSEEFMNILNNCDRLVVAKEVEGETVYVERKYAI